MLMYLITHPYFCICCVDVKQIPEDGKDRSKHFGVLKDCVKNIILTLVHLLVLLHELFINAQT
jgi:hypothetical protein